VTVRTTSRRNPILEPPQQKERDEGDRVRETGAVANVGNKVGEGGRTRGLDKIVSYYSLRLFSSDRKFRDLPELAYRL
jgi:hypothetical protein